MRFLQTNIKSVLVCLSLILLNQAANSQNPVILRSTLGMGGASISLSADGIRKSTPQSIGQYGMTGIFSYKNLELREGFIQPVSIVKPYQKEGNVNKNISVYPNPFTSTVYIKVNKELTGIAEIKIIDFTGKPVHVEIVPAEQIIEVDLSSLQRGIYLLMIKNGDLHLSYKIIKY